MLLFNVANRLIKDDRPLSPEEAATWVNSVERLGAFRDASKLVAIVGRNLISLQEFFASTNDLVRAIPDYHAIADTLDMEGNRLTINFLATMRLLLDGTEGRLKTEYGNAGEPVKVFKARTAQAYDSVFGYRFLYRLRNVSQHAGLPIGRVRVHHQLPSPDSPKSEAIRYAVLSFDRDKLRRLGGSYWGPMEPELAACDPQLAIVPLADAAMAELQAVAAAVAESERPELLKLALALKEIARSVLDHGGVPAVGTAAQDGQKVNFSFVRPPPDVMQWLGVPELAGAI